MPTTRSQDAGAMLDKRQAVDCLGHWEDEEHLATSQAAYKKFQAEVRKKAAAVPTDTSSPSTKPRSSIHKDHGEVALGMKRGRGANHSAPEGSKKARSDSGTEEPDMPTGDKTRVPGLGQRVHWKSGDGGYVHGEVVEVLYADAEVGGESVEASKEDPRLVLETKGKKGVHKPEDVHFD